MWFLRILTGVLHGCKLLLWLWLFMSFSISVSLTGLTKNQFKTHFWGTYRKGFLLLLFQVCTNFYKKITEYLRDEVLFATISLSTNREFGHVFALDFSGLSLYHRKLFWDFFNFSENNFDNTVFSMLLF